MSDYADLIARLEKATGPDRELDAAIQRMFDGRTFHIGAAGLTNAFTASLDAALTLLPPKHDLEIYFDDPTASLHRSGITPWFAQAGTPSGNFLQGKSTSPAIALCIAALKARSVP